MTLLSIAVGENCACCIALDLSQLGLLMLGTAKAGDKRHIMFSLLISSHLSTNPCYVAVWRLNVLLLRSSPMARRASPTSLDLLFSEFVRCRTVKVFPFSVLRSSLLWRLLRRKLKLKDRLLVWGWLVLLVRLKNLNPIKPVWQKQCRCLCCSFKPVLFIFVREKKSWLYF